MWGIRSGTAVFVPQSARGSQVGHSQMLLETHTRLRILASISMHPLLRRREREQGATLVGSLTLSGPHARVLFRRGWEGEPDLTSSPVESDNDLLPSSPRIPIPECSVRSRHEATPFLWVTFVNSRRERLSGSFCLGRCDRDSFRIEPVFEAPAQLTAWLTAREVHARRGPVLGLRGELQAHDGIVLQVRLAADCNRRGEPEGEVETAETPLLPPGARVQVPQRVVTPGIGSGPWVSVALRSGEGSAGDGEIPIGRCVQIH